jgi:hypothetical protein
VNVTACLTTFQDLLTGTSSSKESKEWWANGAAGQTFPATPFTIEGKFSLLQFATWLDYICNKKTRQNLTVTKAVALTKNLIFMCSSVTRLRCVGLDERVVELMTYHAAFLCWILPRDAKREVASWLWRVPVSDKLVTDERVSMSGVDLLVQERSKRCREKMIQIIGISTIILQLSKALNACGDAIASHELTYV